MSKYIDAKKLKSEIERQKRILKTSIQSGGDYGQSCTIVAYDNILSFIDSLQQEQSSNMIQWNGNNLKEVINFTGKSPRFGEWFKSWEEYENYVYTHNNILKLFCEDGSHYEVPVGAWIVKTPDGYNVPSTARFIPAKQEQPEVDLEKEYKEYVEDDPVFSKLTNRIVGLAIARHFLNIGLNARKEE